MIEYVWTFSEKILLDILPGWWFQDPKNQTKKFGK